MVDKPTVEFSPDSFQDTPLAELCLEDALRIGSARSAKLSDKDLKVTSVRFCVDGLYKWYKSFADRCQTGSVFSMARDVSWYWASFCAADPTLSSLVTEYHALLHEITEGTHYTDLAERMDEACKVEKVGRSSYLPFSIIVPMEAYSVILDCAVALGVPFSLFYQLGMGKALASNQGGLYAPWVERKIQPLFDEIMARAEDRLRDFLEIKNTMEFRKCSE